MTLPVEFAHLKIPLEEIVKATKSFANENLIGQGGFGKVYKGTLSRSGESIHIVARRLHHDYGQGDIEFWTEIMMLASLKNENVVSIVGFCDEKDEKIIVNKYETKGSLDKYLNGPTLTWMQRLKICADVAHALKCIHDGRDFSVIHRNIKSSKILLDDNWKPMLSGFEMSIKNTRARRHRLHLAEVIGTIGYVDPAYEKTGFVTHKSDVYSLGVVLFEVLCGRRAFTSQVHEEQDLNNCSIDEHTKPPVSKREKFLGVPTVIMTTIKKWGLLCYDSRQKKSTGQSHQHEQSLPQVAVTPDKDYIKEWVNDLQSHPHTSQSQPPLSDGQPSSFTNVRPSSFGQPSSSNTVHPSSLGKEQPSGSTNILPMEANSSPKEQRFTLHPFFTMKRLDQYLHSPTEELLAQSVKSLYEQGKLGDMIDPDLWKQMNPQSFNIFSETAFSCLKEQRSQRPNIDQVAIKLQKAWELQRKYESYGHLKVGTQDEGTSSNHLKGKNLGHLEIPLIDINLATQNFADTYVIGSGAYGKVYKAELDLPIQEEDIREFSYKRKRTVAIKRILIREDKQGKQGFITEIDLLTNCKHPNIVSLLGFCHEGSHMILVYEFASNGSLGDYLGSTDNLIYLTWAQRIKICIDIARGLHYLHTRVEDERRIIHRDIKSDNILLCKNWEAKIADFGLSRFHPENEADTIYTNNIAGTEVYLDPEYQTTGRLKKESDIYSFGVVLFEILCGKIANDPIYMAEDNKGLAPVARRHFKEGTINEMVDPKIMEEVDELRSSLHKGPNQDSLTTFSKIAYECVAETQVERPTAEVIMKELEKSLSFQESHKDNLHISLEDIKMATQNFSPEKVIGKGGFGKVYEGQLTHPNGCESIVAKRLDKNLGQGEHEYLMELEILFEYKHENIIGLVGYCNEKKERIIVYEHAPKGSLDKHLGTLDVTWMKRLKICIDVATGLAFLHGGALTKEMVIHRDIKSANILLNDDWKAKISDFGLSLITPVNEETEYVISNLVGTVGYVDPLYESMGFLTKESDVYSFGVVLFEIMHGKLLVPDTWSYNQQYVTKMLSYIHIKEIPDWIVFYGIRKEIAPESLSTFRMIVSQCLDNDRKKRPTAEEVLRQLNIALEFQEDYEIWEPKLPKDYKEIIQMSKSQDIHAAQRKRDVCNMFYKGILLQEDKLWFSLGSNGERSEMISASKFSYIKCTPHEWQSIPESRFKKVAKMLDISNLMIRIKTITHLLSSDVMYGVHLVFKFCDSRKVSRKPIYVNLKYTKDSEILHAYFATWRDEDWMMIELCRFLNQKEDSKFKFIIESLSTNYCGDGAVYVEGIEFRAIHNVKHEQIEEKKAVQAVRLLPINYDEDEKLFSLDEVNNKHLMLPAKVALHDSSNAKLFTSKPSASSRFQEVFELLPQQVFRINCTIKSHMLSPYTDYVCYLVFELSEQCDGLHCPVKVRDLLQRKTEEAGIIYLIPPSPWNIHDFIKIPRQRTDGLMEVEVWKLNSTHDLKNNCLPMNLRLTSYEGTMSGLIVCGLEFRPM